MKNSEDFIHTLDILGQVEGQPHHFLHQDANQEGCESAKLEFDKKKYGTLPQCLLLQMAALRTKDRMAMDSPLSPISATLF